MLTPQISLADCGLMVNIPLAMRILQACAQPLALPTRPQARLEPDAHAQYAAVERALTPSRAATKRWLST